ncbi:hypothetical protein [Myxosarcina sp. GI1(2024)]
MTAFGTLRRCLIAQSDSAPASSSNGSFQFVFMPDTYLRREFHSAAGLAAVPGV